MRTKSACDDEIQQAVKKRSRWIYTQLKQFRSQLEHVTPRNYIGGDSHYYLGKKYLLKVISSEDKSKIKLLRGKLEITVSGQNKEHQNNKVKMLISHWYKVRAREVFSRRLNAVLGQALWVSECPPRLHVLTCYVILKVVNT